LKILLRKTNQLLAQKLYWQNNVFGTLQPTSV
jgi:hypothetical protein